MCSKQTFFMLIAFMLSVTLHAQEFQGIATYKSHRKVDLKIDEKASKNPEIEKQIREQLREQFQQEYTLTFNKHESVYKKNEKLSKPNPTTSGIKITLNDDTDITYKNLKEQRYTDQKEIYGKQFLIKDSLDQKNWVLSNETKFIGKYTCFKATFTSDDTSKILSSDGTMETTTKERTTTAWYTPQIPINNGPEDYDGLPGLILEINDGDLTLACTKIVINPSETIDIEEPDKGKKVSQNEFDTIINKKNDEMMEQFQSRRKDGDHRVIRIGG